MALKHADLIAQMTLEEKASMCDGLDYWHSQPVERLGIKSISLNDGPHGIRKKGNPDDTPKGETNLLKGVPAICFPTASATACSWDPDLIYRMGVALGEESLKEKVSVLLGPGTNIKRSPLCGRNFEYFSEDGLLAGEIAAAIVAAILVTFSPSFATFTVAPVLLRLNVKFTCAKAVPAISRAAKESRLFFMI